MSLENKLFYLTIEKSIMTFLLFCSVLFLNMMTKLCFILGCLDLYKVNVKMSEAVKLVAKPILMSLSKKDFIIIWKNKAS